MPPGVDSGFHARHFIQNHPDLVDLVIADANTPVIGDMELFLERLKKKAFPKKPSPLPPPRPPTRGLPAGWEQMLSYPRLMM